MASRYDPVEAPPDRMAPVIPWDDFKTYVFDWKQNQHAGLVGPTEQGKTNLAYHMLEDRDYVNYFAIKTRDTTLDSFAKHGGYVRINDWPPMKRKLVGSRRYTAKEMPKRLLWPDATQLNADAEQRRVFQKALNDIYSDGGWCPVFDDYWYLAHMLGFEKETKKYLANARSNDIPMLICAQRPAGNKLVELFDQTTHLCFFRDNDEPNLRRIAGVGFNSSNAIKGFVANLLQYQFLYVNTRNGMMYRSTAPELKG